jgi:hypothetical protein
MSNQFDTINEFSAVVEAAESVRFLIDAEVAMIGGGEIGVVMI